VGPEVSASFGLGAKLPVMKPYFAFEGAVGGDDDTGGTELALPVKAVQQVQIDATAVGVLFNDRGCALTVDAGPIIVGGDDGAIATSLNDRGPVLAADASAQVVGFDPAAVSQGFDEGWPVFAVQHATTGIVALIVGGHHVSSFVVADIRPGDALPQAGLFESDMRSIAHALTLGALTAETVEFVTACPLSQFSNLAASSTRAAVLDIEARRASTACSPRVSRGLISWLSIRLAKA